MSKWIAIFLISLATMGCGDSQDSTGGAVSAESASTEATRTAEEATEAIEEAAAAEEATGARDLAGISVDVGDDGSITLSGTDRWGDRIDTTYASLEYFTGAVETLKRSITEEQGDALDALVEELGEGAGEAENAPVETTGGGEEE